MRAPLPAEELLRQERGALVDTLAGLAPEDFAAGPTLCAGWAPRDVLAHLLGVDSSARVYLRHGPRLGAANAEIVAAARAWSRPELLERARRWAARPAPLARVLAPVLIGDLAVHHQDVLRPRGNPRVLSPALARAVFREGLVLGGVRRLAGYRLIPTDGLHRPLGAGRPVRGSTEALGMWLAGRESARAELNGL